MNPGTLFLCATPIGNLEDITLRCIRILKECDYIACEDTRNTLKLLNRFEITTPMLSFHEHNKTQKGPKLIELLQNGKNISLVTDAGTPGISDPGETLVELCITHNICVTALPGACAAINALIVSGLPAKRFAFEGFLPHSKAERIKILKNLTRETRTIIFYEAPHRLQATLADMFETLGNRRVAAVKELTKKFEHINRNTISELIAQFEKTPPKGEFVLVVEGMCEEAIRQDEISAWQNIDLAEHIKIYTDNGFSEMEAMKKVAADRGVSKREIYSKFKIDN